MFHLALFLAKKKESKIKDYSEMSEEEKLELLAEYKKLYQLQNILKEQGISFEDNKLVIDETVPSSDITEKYIAISNSDEVEFENDETDINTEDEIKEDTTEVETEDEIEIEVEEVIEAEAEDEIEVEVEEVIETETEDENEVEVEDEIDVDIVMIDGTDIDFKHEEIVEVSEGKEVLEENYTSIDNDNKVVESSNNRTNTKSDAFEYSTFTPYKPKFDSLDLDNNMFAFSDTKIETASDGEYVEKYQMKSKPHKSLKTSQDGRYKYSDSYIATKSKKIIPVFNILVVLFGIISLAVSVTGMVYCFDKFQYTECVLNLVFAISSFMICLSAVSKDEGISKISGFTVIGALLVDIIIAALAKYQDYLYMIVSTENTSDRITGIIMLVSLVFKYAFFISMFIYFSKKDKKVLYTSVVIGVISVIIAFIIMIMDINNNNIIKYYDVIPAAIAIIAYQCSLVFSGIEREKR